MSVELEARLRELESLEGEADLYAATCQFGRATRLMKQVNRERADVLGMPYSTSPNVLRERARQALQEPKP